MKTLKDYPNLLNAIVLMYADNGMINRSFSEQQLASKPFPPRNSSHDPFTEAHIDAAEAEAERLATAHLKDFIPEDMIDSDLANPYDNALETMATGESTVVDLLVTWSFSSALHAVLESAFDGELHECLTRSARQSKAATGGA